jgi:hypothetical protein
MAPAFMRLLHEDGRKFVVRAERHIGDDDRGERRGVGGEGLSDRHIGQDIGVEV